MLEKVPKQSCLATRHAWMWSIHLVSWWWLPIRRVELVSYSVVLVNQVYSSIYFHYVLVSYGFKPGLLCMPVYTEKKKQPIICWVFHIALAIVMTMVDVCIRTRSPWDPQNWTTTTKQKQEVFSVPVGRSRWSDRKRTGQRMAMFINMDCMCLVVELCYAVLKYWGWDFDSITFRCADVGHIWAELMCVFEKFPNCDVLWVTIPGFSPSFQVYFRILT